VGLMSPFWGDFLIRLLCVAAVSYDGGDAGDQTGGWDDNSASHSWDDGAGWQNMGWGMTNWAIPPPPPPANDPQVSSSPLSLLSFNNI